MAEKKKKRKKTPKAKEKETKKTPKKSAAQKAAKKPVSPKGRPAPKIIPPTPAATLLRWKAPDYYTFEKSPYWSLAIGLIAVVLSLALLYTQNYFPIVIIILAVIVTFQVAHEKPKEQEFVLDEKGVLVRNVYLPYLELKSFWIAEHGEKSILYLEPVHFMRAPLVVPLGKQDAEQARIFLLTNLPEKLERGENFSEKLIRIFRL